MSETSKPRDPRSPASAPAGRPQGAVVYQLKRPLAELPDNLRLRNHEWGALFAVTGEHSCAQIAGLLGLAAEERDRVFARLAAFGLIEERPLTYGEYLRALATWRDDEPRPLAAFLRGGQAMPGAPVARPAPTAASPAVRGPAIPAFPGVVSGGPAPVAATPARPRPPEVTTADSDLNITRAFPTYDRRQLVAPDPPKPPVVPAVQTAAEAAAEPAFLPLEAPPAPVAPGRGPLSLRALMQHILAKAGDPQSGQLDIYRVFIRINTRLLQKNGITTLRFQDDRLIEDPELQSAIAASVEKALGFPCPPEVFIRPT